MPIDRVEQLTVFLRVAATGSFTKTADQLALPRPTVSLAVQQLEARLGVRLFYRTTRSVTLTQDGEAMVERANALVNDMQELEARFRPSDQGLSGRLRVEVPSRIARLVIAPHLPAWLAEHPGLALDLGSSDRRVDLVQESVDCALRVGMLADSGLVARELGEMVLVNCASPAYLARHGTPRTPDDLPGHQMVSYSALSSGRAAPWEWQQGAQLRSLVLPSTVAVNNVESYIACGLAGLGLIQVPEYDVRAHLQCGELVAVLPAYSAAPMPVHMLYPHRTHVPRRVRVFIEWLERLLVQTGTLTPPTARPPRGRGGR